MMEILWVPAVIAFFSTPAYVLVSVAYLVTLGVPAVAQPGDDPKAGPWVARREAKWGVVLASHGLLGSLALLMANGLGLPILVGSVASIAVAVTVIRGRPLRRGWRWVPLGYAGAVALTLAVLLVYALVTASPSGAGDSMDSAGLGVFMTLSMLAAAVTVATRFALAVGATPPAVPAAASPVVRTEPYRDPTPTPGAFEPPIDLFQILARGGTVLD